MRFTRSAASHGVGREDALFALDHYVRVFPGEGDLEVEMYIGPSRRGLLLEIGLITDDDGVRVIHAMPARPKYLNAL